MVASLRDDFELAGPYEDVDKPRVVACPNETNGHAIGLPFVFCFDRALRERCRDRANQVKDGIVFVERHWMSDPRGTKNLMPTVLIIDGFRFFFFSNEGSEPPHIHVEKGNGYAKFWLQPPRIAQARGFKRPELNRATILVNEYEANFLEAWREHFGA